MGPSFEKKVYFFQRLSLLKTFAQVNLLFGTFEIKQKLSNRKLLRQSTKASHSTHVMSAG